MIQKRLSLSRFFVLHTVACTNNRRDNKEVTVSVGFRQRIMSQVDINEKFSDLFSAFDECAGKEDDDWRICQFEYCYRHWMFRYTGMLVGDKNYIRDVYNLGSIKEYQSDLYK